MVSVVDVVHVLVERLLNCLRPSWLGPNMVLLIRDLLLSGLVHSLSRGEFWLARLSYGTKNLCACVSILWLELDLQFKSI